MSKRPIPPAKQVGEASLPSLHTADEVAELLRTSTKAVYAMFSKGRLPGGVRVGRRLLFRHDRLLQFISENSVALPGEMPE